MVVPNDRLIVALGGCDLLQLGLVIRDAAGNVFGNVVAIEDGICFWLFIGRKHGDFEPDPALDIHEAVTGTISQLSFVTGVPCVPQYRISGSR